MIDEDPTASNWATVYTLEMIGDKDGITRLLHAPEVAPADAADMVDWLRRAHVFDDQGARAEYQRLLKAAPHSWGVASVYGDYLESRKAYAEKRAVMTAWIANNLDDPGLSPIHAKTAIARTYGLEGNHAQAWATVQPLLRSQAASPMERGAIPVGSWAA